METWVKIAKRISLGFAAIITAIAAGVTLYALPAILSLPRGRRPGIEEFTVERAARELLGLGKTGWDLVEAARALVAARMQYCRRNSFDPAPKAFARGYGYCQQQAFALAGILTALGIEARVVQAFKNRFPDGGVGGHAWVRVTLGGEQRDIDSLHYDAQAGVIDFTPLTKIQGYSPLERVFFGWGGAAVNAHRYYVTAKDS